MSCGYDLNKSRPPRPLTQKRSTKKVSASKPSEGLPIAKVMVWVIIASIIGGIWLHQRSQAEALAEAAQGAMAQGRRFYDAGQYAEAIESFQKAQELGDGEAVVSIQECRERIREMEAAQTRARPIPLNEAVESLSSASLSDVELLVTEFAKMGERFDPHITVHVTQVTGDSQYNCQGRVDADDIDMCFFWHGYYRHRTGEGVGGWELLDSYVSAPGVNEAEPTWIGYHWQHSETISY